MACESSAQPVFALTNIALVALVAGNFINDVVLLQSCCWVLDTAVEVADGGCLSSGNPNCAVILSEQLSKSFSQFVYVWDGHVHRLKDAGSIVPVQNDVRLVGVVRDGRQAVSVAMIAGTQILLQKSVD